MNRLHPLSVFALVISAAFISALTADPVTHVIILSSGLAAAAINGVRRPWLYLLLIPSAALINPLFSHRGATALFFFGVTPFTLEAVLAGLGSGVWLCAMLLWFAAYSRVMTADKHLYLFSALTPRLGLTLSAALRFVPLFLRRFREIYLAQMAMGLFSGKSAAQRLRGRLMAFSAAFDWGIENGVATAVSMRARGCGAARRTSYTLFRLTAADTAVISISVICAAVITANRSALRFVYYPTVSALPAAALPRLACLTLCIVPVFLYFKERLVWILSASRISALHTPEPPLRP